MCPTPASFTGVGSATARGRRVTSRTVPTTLAELTTLRLGGPIGRIVDGCTSGELVDATRTADAAGEPVLLVGGGSNLVAADGGWPGVVVRVRSSGIHLDRHDDQLAVRGEAGEAWDDFVALAVG